MLTSSDVNLQLCAQKEAFTPTHTLNDPQHYIGNISVDQEYYVDEDITISYTLTNDGEMYDAFIEFIHTHGIDTKYTWVAKPMS